MHPRFCTSSRRKSTLRSLAGEASRSILVVGEPPDGAKDWVRCEVGTSAEPKCDLWKQVRAEDSRLIVDFRIPLNIPAEGLVIWMFWLASLAQRMKFMQLVKCHAEELDHRRRKKGVSAWHRLAQYTTGVWQSRTKTTMCQVRILYGNYYQRACDLNHVPDCLDIEETWYVNYNITYLQFFSEMYFCLSLWLFYSSRAFDIHLFF